MPDNSYYCMRCGEHYYGGRCEHSDTEMAMTRNLANRIKVLYALGKRTNPNHDTTSYYDLARQQIACSRTE